MNRKGFNYEVLRFFKGFNLIMSLEAYLVFGIYGSVFVDDLFVVVN